ncbi:MAG TPA: SCO family protein [Gammaproteobacteria bacterium]|jgi:protein SCO1/2|nr:SCO family protein [Gammaproteobacteria bacterium]
MAHQQTLSIQKIVFAVVFISAALMTSLFIFHLNHPAQAEALRDQSGLIFPVARDIKSFELLTTTHEKFTQSNLLGHWSLVVFGFTRCNTICPATLNMLSHAYPALHQQQADLQIIFVSLDPDYDALSQLQRYTTNYHPSFLGVTGNIKEVRKLQSQLGVYSAADPNHGTQLQHTPSLFLINPEGKWVGLFQSGLSPLQFADAFHESLQILSSRKQVANR